VTDPREVEPPVADRPAPPVTDGPVTAVAAALSDGEWHRLHPASPLLKGGLFLLAVIGFVITQARERLIELFIPGAGYDDGDPLGEIVDRGLVGWALLAIAVTLVVIVAVFWLSWRMHTFRITDEVVEVRSGLVFRTNRKARLDRIQGINIVRPFIARLFGAAKVEINQAGQDANVKLEYLATRAADDLRREILRLASGSRATSVPTAASTTDSVVDRRVSELLAPELDPDAAEPESVVRLGPGRLLGSILLSGGTVFVVIAAVSVVSVSIIAPDAAIGLFGLIPAALGFIGYSVQKFTKSLRYTIAGTPDGVRVGFGLLSTSNETLPPGRIHSVKVSQPLLWRPFGWWEIKVNRASHSSTSGAAGQQNTTILPVGTRGDVRRVLGLVLPEFASGDASGAGSGADSGDASGAGSAIDDVTGGSVSRTGSSSGGDAIDLAERGLARPAQHDGYTSSPRRAVVLRWFSWRRNGFAVSDGSVLLRRGVIWRELVVVPFARSQSVSAHQGPLLRMLRLAAVRVHTVAGPIVASIGALDRGSAIDLFDAVARGAILSSGADTSHRWRASEPAASTVGPPPAGPAASAFGPPPSGPAVVGPPAPGPALVTERPRPAAPVTGQPAPGPAAPTGLPPSSSQPPSSQPSSSDPSSSERSSSQPSSP
jgi:putative membrane protein